MKRLTAWARGATGTKDPGHGLTSVALGLGPQQEGWGLGIKRRCQLVEEPGALSMSERAWASSLNVCVTLLYFGSWQ